jgi:hypothetical protein
MEYVDVGVYGVTNFNPYDTGWFGKKLFKKVAKAASSVAKKSFLPVIATQQALNVGRGLIQGGPKGIIPLAVQMLPQAQQAMKMAGPMGMVASGAAGALVATVQGKSLENIAWAAAEGASPPGVDRVIAAAHQLRQGAPVLTVAIGQARQQFTPGSVGQRAFDIGVNAAKGGAKGALSNARNQLKSATEKAAFDAAIGTISKAARGINTSPTITPRIALNAPRSRALNLLRPATNLAVEALQRNPRLRFMPPQLAAMHTGLSLRRIVEARGIVDTGTVTDKLNTYVIKSGDTGYKLAQRLTGDGNRWKEIPQVNKVGMGAYKQSKDMKIVNKKDAKGKIILTTLDPFYSGLTINLPGDWAGSGVTPQGPVVYPVPAATPPMQPPPIPGTTPAPPPIMSTPPTIPAGYPTPPQLPPSPDNTIPMPTPAPIPGQGSSPIPFPAPPDIKPPDAGPTPTVPGSAADKKKKDGAAAALALAAAGLLFFV